MKSFRRPAGVAHILLACVCLLLALPLPSPAQQTQIKVDPEAAQNYVALAGGVSPARLLQTINDLSGIHYAVPNQPAAAPVAAYSRVAGTPGGDAAQDYVRQQFQAIFGAGHVSEEPFTVTTPIDNGAFVQGAGQAKPFALQPLWPNLVRTSTLPAAGIDGPLIYAGRGELSGFRGKSVEGSVVLLDFNCGTDWLNAARLGAKAIIFYSADPDHARRRRSQVYRHPRCRAALFDFPRRRRRAAIGRADNPQFSSASDRRQPVADGAVGKHGRRHSPARGRWQARRS